ncbi:MAG: Rieske (2Fe-2S) protein [Bacteroidota bacterium]
MEKEIINQTIANNQNSDNSSELSRGQFLKQLGLSSATLMAFYCMGTGLTACSSSKEADPTPSNPGGGGGSNKLDFTLDLTTNDFKSLKTDGEFLIKDSLIIANAGGKYVALSKACSHEGTTIGYRKSENDFRCPNHFSVFNVDGTVKTGPATSSLKAYNTEILENGNKLRVFE